MLSGITILQNNVDYLQMVEDKRVWTVCLSNSSVGAQAHLRHDGGHQWHIVSLLVEHGAVCTIVHSVEKDFKFDLSSNGKHGLNVERNQVKVVNIVILVNEAGVGQLSVGVVRDRGRDI